MLNGASPLIASALALGVPCFPVGADKAPVVATGFKAASRDPRIIRAAFSLDGAAYVGVPMGAASGLVGVDVDVRPDKSGLPWLEANADRLPRTRTHATPSGGRHLLFKAPPEGALRNSAGRLAPGVDVRCEGGYLVWWPSAGYDVLDQTEPADMPDWLLAACTPAAPPPPSPPPNRAPATGADERYAEAALVGECAAVATTPEGSRNHRLNIAAVKLGSLIAAGLLPRATVEAELAHAAHTAGLTGPEITATIRSGLEFGMTSPRQIPERMNGSAHADPAASEPPPDDPDDPGWWESVDAGAGTTEPPDEAEGNDAAESPTESGQASEDLGVLSFDFWLTRDLPKPENLLGHVVTSGARIFVFAPTGIGKTHLALAKAAALATGGGFCHWEGSRPCRALFVDGEMPRDLVQDRLRDIARRETDAAARARLSSNLFALCMEDFPKEMPFNTDAGRAFVLDVINRLGGIDVVVFDNRMALTEGDMKEEEPWSQTIPLVTALTRQRIAQIWVDHMGHDASRGYGTKTKEWRFDAVIVLSAVERPDADLAFRLEFTKARRRRPETRTDFEPVILTLTNDVWSVDGKAAEQTGRRSRLSKNSMIGLSRLHDAVAGQGALVPSRPGFPTSPVHGVNVEIWRDAFYDGTPAIKKENKRRAFSRVVEDLVSLHVIGTHENWVWAVRDA